MMISELKNLFLESRKRGTGGAKRKNSAASVRVYERNLEIFQDFLMSLDDGGILSYKQLKRTHLIDFLDWLDKKEASGDWSKATRLQMLRCLKAFFRWVDGDEDCQEAGLKGFQKYLPAIERNPTKLEMPELKDLKTFKNSINTTNKWGYRDYVAVSLMLETGIRVGEVCNIKINHMRLDDLVVYVEGKTGPRQVAITTDMAKLLKGWLKKRSTVKSAANSEYVFLSKRGPKMDSNGFGQSFRKHCAKMGLPRITPHTLRHMMATNYLRKGGDIEKLRMMTGHTTYSMLQGYLHLAKIGGKEMQQELERVSLLKEL